jgi:type IV secretion system protein VirB9
MRSLSSLLAVLPALAGLSACSTLARPFRHRPAALPAPAPAPAAARPLRGRPAVTRFGAPVFAAQAQYRRSGVARAVAVDGFTVWPYGHGPATMVCAPLRACVVELDPEETLTAPPIAGDTRRWAFEVVQEGGAGRPPLVVVKAGDCDLSTNLVLATDRRMYQVLLHAPRCRPGTTNPAGVPTHLAWYYPDEGEAPAPAALRFAANASNTAVAGNAGIRVTGAAAAPGAVVNARYSARAPKGVAWRPTQVWDDGARTYVVLPAAARRDELPVLYGLEDDGSRVLVNYNAAPLPDGGRRFVADRVFRRAVLVARRGKAEHVVLIENRGATRPGG